MSGQTCNQPRTVALGAGVKSTAPSRGLALARAVGRAVLVASTLVLALVVGAGCRGRGATGAATDGPWTGLTFVEDDFEVALARARNEHRALFVDAWAPWCHTCLSMKAFVFNDPALASLSTAFVWAAVDTEKPKSEPFLRKFPMKNWPTLWVIDPTTEKPILKWAGSVTATELVTLLSSATLEQAKAGPGATEAAAAWMRGNRDAAEGKPDEAIAEYQSALQHAPDRWSGRAPVVDALASQLQAAQRYPDCVALCQREWPALSPGTSRLNVALAAIGCADALPKGAPERGAVGAIAEAAALRAADPADPVLADDRSSLFEELVDYYRSAGDEPKAQSLARQWRDFLDAEAGRAPNPAARAVFDSHRIGAYAAVGEADKAIPMLEQSERDFPDDYNAPTRLAKVYLDLGKLDLALASVRRAEAKVYGPRTLRVLSIEADIWAAKHQAREQKDALDRAVQMGDKLGVTGGYRDLLERLRARAARL